VLIVSIGGYAVVQWFNGSVARVHLDLGGKRPPKAPSGSQNWLLVGTDAGRPNVPGERSDTTILTHLDANGTTTNVSFPRDTLVTIPAYVDAQHVHHPAHKDKFNAAITLGGPSLLVETVQDMTNIRIDHYVSINLEGFKKISEALDGVEVCIRYSPLVQTYSEKGITHISTNIDDSFSGFKGVDGPQKVVGDQALAFVRQRHGLPDSDLSRIERQQQFLGSVFRTATKGKLLFNPVAVTRLLEAVHGSLTLDDGTSLSDLEKLGQRLRGVDPSKVAFETIPTRSLAATDTELGTIDSSNPNVPELTPNGQSESVGSVQLLDQAGFNTMLAKLKGASAAGPTHAHPPATAPSATPLTVPPAQIRVTVENGVGVNGLAGRVTSALAQDGFRTGVPGPAYSTGYAKSEIHYRPDDKGAALTVAAAVPGSILKPDTSVTDGVILIAGANFSRVLPLSGATQQPISPSASPRSSAGTSPSPVGVSAASEGNRCTY
jgi:LCP family protein required for cell wall assembly